jgi:hypothetical protein
MLYRNTRSGPEIDFEGTSSEQLDENPSEFCHGNGEYQTPAQDTDKEHDGSDNQDEQWPVDDSAKNPGFLVPGSSECRFANERYAFIVVGGRGSEGNGGCGSLKVNRGRLAGCLSCTRHGSSSVSYRDTRRGSVRGMSISVPRSRRAIIGSAVSYSLVSVFLVIAIVTVFRSALAFDILAKWPSDIPRKTT